MAPATEVSPKKNSDVSVVHGTVFGAGICYRSISGVEMGHALVGLQRSVYESEWTYLSAVCSGIWPGRNVIKLLSDALLYATVS